MPITSIQVKNALPKERPYKLHDGGGLYLRILPNGGKYWQLKYRYAKKEKLYSIGTPGKVSLKQARMIAAELKVTLAAGKDPSIIRKTQKLIAGTVRENHFEAIAEEWVSKQALLWTPKHAKLMLRRLKADIFPAIGSFPIHEITAPILLAALRRVEERDAIDLVHRLHQTTGQIFRYAIATGKADRDIAADLRGAFKTRKKQHMAYLKEGELPEFFARLKSYDGDKQTKLAMRFLIHTFVRTSELRGAKWVEIDLKKAEWRIPAERMKMRELHIVPLSPQAIAILKEQKKVGHLHEHVFPNRNKPRTHISENTILFALYRMGYHGRATGHGFRATASTILNENGFRADVIERQLAHGERNNVRASYNHAQYLKERLEMMKWWSNYLDKISSPAIAGVTSG